MLVPLRAGAIEVGPWRFLLVDALCSVFYASVYVLPGLFFHDQLEQARREAELASFEIDASRPHGSGSLGSLETILSRAEHVSALAASLSSDCSWQEWQPVPSDAQQAESELRNVVARRVERATNGDSAEDADPNLSSALARWTEKIQRLSLEGGRIAVVSQVAAEAQQLGSQSERTLFSQGNEQFCA